MTKHTMAKSKVALAALVLVSGALQAIPASAETYPITPAQKATANQVAEKGVPLSELAADAPDSYTIKRGDTLWAISGIFLKRPWRWPELWGMNLEDIKNPHLIYPGQVLYLDKSNGRATLRTKLNDSQTSAISTLRVSPRTRYESLADNALPTLKSHLIEAFLAEPVVVDEAELKAAPRIVATQEGRVLLSRGDRAYARGPGSNMLMDDPAKKQKEYRVFRNATPLKDPSTGEILGYEAQYVGKAILMRSESTQESTDKDGKVRSELVPATIDIVSTKEEMRVGDKLLPEPSRQLLNYVPHAPQSPVNAQIMSVYGSAVVNAAQNQVVTINRGTRNGLEVGHVLAIMKDGQRMVDKTDEARPMLKLPDERDGLLMVFRTFDKVSYGLILDTSVGVKIGDRLINPR